MEVPSVAEALLALPPSRFTAERNALAKALAAKGDPAAAAVRRLPRPVGLAWLLNRLVRERRQDVDALVAAGERLRAGQRGALSGAGADALRDAMDDLRARARTLRAEAERILAAEGRPVAPPALARLELLLRVLAPVPGPARDALLRGVLVREPELAGGDDLGGFAVIPGGRSSTSPLPPRPRGERARVRGEAHPKPARAAGAEAREAQRARAEERKARARAAQQLRDRARAVAAALRTAKAAGALADREEREAARAMERAQRARARAAAARAEAARLAERVRALDPRSSPP